MGLLSLSQVHPMVKSEVLDEGKKHVNKDIHTSVIEMINLNTYHLKFHYKLKLFCWTAFNADISTS